ncbi:MAG: hypothetical protein LDL41_15850, partial [Coleofasciculus sp. S288]|nr:hypothetical protein [Coleofasciculus sp. S288]
GTIIQVSGNLTKSRFLEKASFAWNSSNKIIRSIYLKYRNGCPRLTIWVSQKAKCVRRAIASILLDYVPLR